MDAVGDDHGGDHIGVITPGQGQNAADLPIVLQVGLTVFQLLTGGNEGQGAVLGQGPGGIAGPAGGDDSRLHRLRLLGEVVLVPVLQSLDFGISQLLRSQQDIEYAGLHAVSLDVQLGDTLVDILALGQLGIVGLGSHGGELQIRAVLIKQLDQQRLTVQGQGCNLAVLADGNIGLGVHLPVGGAGSLQGVLVADQDLLTIQIGEATLDGNGVLQVGIGHVQDGVAAAGVVDGLLHLTGVCSDGLVGTGGGVDDQGIMTHGILTVVVPAGTAGSDLPVAHQIVVFLTEVEGPALAEQIEDEGADVDIAVGRAVQTALEAQEGAVGIGEVAAHGGDSLAGVEGIQLLRCLGLIVVGIVVQQVVHGGGVSVVLHVILVVPGPAGLAVDLSEPQVQVANGIGHVVVGVVVGACLAAHVDGIQGGHIQAGRGQEGIGDVGGGADAGQHGGQVTGAVIPVGDALDGIALGSVLGQTPLDGLVALLQDLTGSGVVQLVLVVSHSHSGGDEAAVADIVPVVQVGDEHGVDAELIQSLLQTVVIQGLLADFLLLGGQGIVQPVVGNGHAVGGHGGIQQVAGMPVGVGVRTHAAQGLHLHPGPVQINLLAGHAVHEGQVQNILGALGVQTDIIGAVIRNGSGIIQQRIDGGLDLSKPLLHILISQQQSLQFLKAGIICQQAAVLGLDAVQQLLGVGSHIDGGDALGDIAVAVIGGEGDVVVAVEALVGGVGVDIALQGHGAMLAGRADAVDDGIILRINRGDLAGDGVRSCPAARRSEAWSGAGPGCSDSERCR